jgi:ATP-binding cassette subfamily B protein
MIKLMKYLKPFLLSLLLAVGLLYVQATTDLELPRYLSDIVNVGIMSDGIEHASPNVLSEQGMAFVKALIDDEGDLLLDNHYSLIPAGDKITVNGITLIDHPALYVLDDGLDEASLRQLDETFGEAVWIVIHLSQAMGSGSGSIDQNNIDVAQLYQLPGMIAMLPSGTQMLDQARISAAAMDANLKTQTGIVFVGSVYYADLNIDVATYQMNYIIVTGLWMLLLTLVGVSASILVSLLSSRIGAGVAKALRKDVFAKVESFSSEEFNRFATSSLITRTTNDVTQVQQLIVMSIRMIFYAPIIAFGGIRMIFRTNVNMTWIIGVAVAALILLITTIFLLAIPKFKIIQKLIDKVNLVAREGLSGLMVIRAFGNQAFENDRFDNANKDLTKTTLFVNRIITVMMPSMMLIMNLTILSIIWFGSHQVADGNLRIGDMLAFMNYSMQVIMAFLMITMMFIFMPRAAVSANRIAEVLETKPVIIDPVEPKKWDAPVQGILRFDNVSFRFGSASENVLKDISFTALPGQTTAIIGSTGSGKSTLVNLIPRFYDVSEGSITLDGIDIREVAQTDLRRHVSYVPQKGMILSGTIDSNLRYGRPEATIEDIEEAAAIAQAKEFIDEREEKLQAPISQGGTNVSGGQKQRLSIARALVKKAPVIIFDDSFSALDFKTDQLLRRAMHKAVQGATLLIVAQRVGTIMNADQILVMDQGRIVARGTHQELLQTSPIYYEIASSQLAKEELARG